jgi:putative ABC transport system permease protein
VGIPLVRGREFNEQDTRASTGVVIVSQSLVREYFPGEDPMGRHLQVDLVSRGAPDLEPDPVREIVGIAADVKAGNRVDPRPTMYVPFRQHLDGYPEGGVLRHVTKDAVIRTRGDGPGYAALQQAVAAIDRDQLVLRISSVRERLGANAVEERFWMRVLSIFAALACLLAAVGIYGVVSVSVAQRTHEFGIRMALGAGQKEVLMLVTRRGLSLALVGVGLGVIGALVLTDLIEAQLFGVTATDPLTFVATALLLVVVALLASYIPARRATRVDPISALSVE